ncbi:MAG: LysO family transporter [Anaerotignum sp.]|nr:LysO family transporter [Anaerotignum sp.]
MWDIFLVVGIGFFIGYKGLIKEKGIKLNSKLQTVWLMLLIFCMGVSIGRNGEIVKNLPVLGGKAVLFAIMTAVCSTIVVYLFSRLFLDKEGGK